MSYDSNKKWRQNNREAFNESKNRYYAQFSKNAVNNNDRWTKEDDLLISSPNHLPDRVLSKRLGRSVRSIQMRRTKIKKLGGEVKYSSPRREDARIGLSKDKDRDVQIKECSICEGEIETERIKKGLLCECQDCGFQFMKERSGKIRVISTSAARNVTSIIR